MSRKIILTLPEPLFQKLSLEQKNYSYASLQALIVEILRDHVFRAPASGGEGKRGRPSRIREMRILTRKNVFTSKGGKPIDI